GMVRDASDNVIVRSTIDLAHNMGLVVVAEGVEDEATLERLRTLGCDMVQGYFLSRPLPMEQVAAWMRGPNPGRVGEPAGLRRGVEPPAVDSAPGRRREAARARARAPASFTKVTRFPPPTTPLEGRLFAGTTENCHARFSRFHSWKSRFVAAIIASTPF